MPDIKVYFFSLLACLHEAKLRAPWSKFLHPGNIHLPRSWDPPPNKGQGLGLSTPACERPGQRGPGTRSGQWPGLRNLLSPYPTPEKEGGLS